MYGVLQLENLISSGLRFEVQELAEPLLAKSLRCNLL